MRGKWLHETFHWGLSGEMGWNKASGFKSLNKTYSSFIIIFLEEKEYIGFEK